jgi:hypothetical protein
MSSPFSENPYQTPEASLDPPPNPSPFRSPRYCWEAITALVCAVIGIVPCLLSTIILEPFALVLSISALRKTRGDPNLKGRGIAIAGMTISIVGLLLIVLYILIAMH